METHSSTPAWKIPWAGEPGRLQSMGSQRDGHDWATSLSFSCTGEGNGKPLQCSCLENPRDGGAWWAAVYGVAQSRTRLKRLSSRSSSNSKGHLIGFLEFLVGSYIFNIYFHVYYPVSFYCDQKMVAVPFLLYGVSWFFLCALTCDYFLWMLCMCLKRSVLYDQSMAFTVFCRSIWWFFWCFMSLNILFYQLLGPQPLLS